jgi:hypothetical protein
MVRHSAAALVLAVASVTLPAAAANLIKDGGFEQPPTASGGYTLYQTGDTFSHWDVVGASGNVATVSTSFAQNGFSFPAKSGQAWLDLTGVSSTATGVAQTVKTTVGASYTLTFWVGNVYDPGGIFGTTSTVDAYAGSTLLIAATNADKATTVQKWKKFSTTFTATAARTTVSFINADPSSDTNCGLDAISLTPAAEAPASALTDRLSR